MDDRNPLLEDLDISSDSDHIPLWFLENMPLHLVSTLSEAASRLGIRSMVARSSRHGPPCFKYAESVEAAHSYRPAHANHKHPIMAIYHHFRPVRVPVLVQVLVLLPNRSISELYESVARPALPGTLDIALHGLPRSTMVVSG